jgi:hypothetical protein
VIQEFEARIRTSQVYSNASPYKTEDTSVDKMNSQHEQIAEVSSENSDGD